MKSVLKKTGVAYFLQPPRGTTMEMFMTLANVIFDVRVVMEYSKVIKKQHEAFKECSEYDPNLHYPQLLILTFKKKID